MLPLPLRRRHGKLNQAASLRASAKAAGHGGEDITLTIAGGSTDAAAGCALRPRRCASAESPAITPDHDGSPRRWSARAAARRTATAERALASVLRYDVALYADAVGSRG